MALSSNWDVVPGDLDTTEAAGNVLSEFLEVAIHNILYTRGIYKENLFERRRKYNVAVYMCAHPELNQYICDVLKGIKHLLAQGLVEKLVLVIKDKDHSTLEEFVIVLGGLKHEALKNETSLSQLEQSFRAVLLTISTSEASLNPLPAECTFVVLVHTYNEASEIMEGHSTTTFPWVLADNQGPENSSGARTVPLKQLHNNILKMKVYVQDWTSRKSGSKDLPTATVT